MTTLTIEGMGKPGDEVLAGSVTLETDGETLDVLAIPTWGRAVAGLHLVMQYPTEVPGVRLDAVLVEAFASRSRSTDGLTESIRAEAARIDFDERFLDRSLNDLPGGEKKRNETLQLAMIGPKIAILDELDSGLDIDALRHCARRVEDMSNDPDQPLGVLAITHYSRLLDE